MKRKNRFIFLLILGLLALSVAACGGVDLPAGHRYGNPVVTYADQKVTVKYVCVDCDYEVIEERVVATQIADETAWFEAFGNINTAQYSLAISASNGNETVKKVCVLSDNRGYYASIAPEELSFTEERYTLQKTDGSFITYLLQEGMGVSVSKETDNRYWTEMKRESSIYLSLEDKFGQFVYNAGSGSYVSVAPMDVELIGAEGESLGVKKMQNISVNIADGKICEIKANYREINEYLEETEIELHFYNIGFSVVKVPQSVIDEVTGTGSSAVPGENGEYLLYKAKNGSAMLLSADTAISGAVTIRSTYEKLPVVTIGEGAFSGCDKLTTITIPVSVTTIEDRAFFGCDSLTDIYYAGTQAQWDNIAIGWTGNEALEGATIHVSKPCEHSYDAGTVVEEPTCSDAGIRVYTCMSCGKAKTEYIPKLTTHNYTNGLCTSCGAEDPHYAENVEEEEIGGVLGAVVDLLKAVIKLIFFFV